MTDTVTNSGHATADAAAQPLFSADAVRRYADQVAPGWHVAHKPEGSGSFGRRIDATGESLDQLYVVLDARPQPTYLPGEVLDLTRREGAVAAAGDPLAEISADKEHAWEALRALWGVGEPEDIEAVQRYARGVPGMPERLQEQAMLTLQAIQARQAQGAKQGLP